MNGFKSSMKKFGDKANEKFTNVKDSVTSKKQDTKTTDTNTGDKPHVISSNSTVTTTSSYGGNTEPVVQTSHISRNQDGGIVYSNAPQPPNRVNQPPPPPSRPSQNTFQEQQQPVTLTKPSYSSGNVSQPLPPSRPNPPHPTTTYNSTNNQPVSLNKQPMYPNNNNSNPPPPPSRPSRPPPPTNTNEPVSLNKSTSSTSSVKDGASNLTRSFNKQTEQIDTNTKIALSSIGVNTHDGQIKANLPVLKLQDRDFISTIQYTEVILEIEKCTLKSIELGKKTGTVAKKQRLVIYKTVQEEIIIIQIGEVYIYTSIWERPSFRSEPFEYIIGDNYGNIFKLKVDQDSVDKESMDKLEVILMYYSTFYRVPVKAQYNDETAQKIDKTSGKVESGSMAVNKGLISAGGYVAKGAGKVGDVYKNNSKKYDGPEMTEEQRKELEDPNSALNKSNQTSQKVMKGTASVSQGIVKGFGFVGSKVSETYHSTDYYKEKQEKQKQHEAIHGKNEKKEAGASAAGTGVSAFKNVWSGLEEGVLISARGVRDASVDAKKHSHGEFESEKHKKSWNTAGDVTVSMVNVVSIMSATWIKGALYAAAGAVSYDPDKPQALSGSFWKGGWVSIKTDLLSGSGWTTRWMVLRNPTLAIYHTSKDPHDKPLEFYYLHTVKSIQKLALERAQKPYAFEIKTNAGSIYLSTDTGNDIDYSEEKLGIPNQDVELFQWINYITSVSNYIGDLEVPKEKKQKN